MNYFVIQWPWVLLLLLGLIPLGGLLKHARIKRNRIYQSLGQEQPTSNKTRDRLRIACLGLLILALSRPGYAPERRAVAQTGRDVVFAIDVSRSMLARDAQPSRLDSARQGVRDALEQFRNERVGLIIYAGSASILCPLTRDYDFVRYMLDQAAPRAVDFGGTTLLSAVEKSVDNIFMEGREGMQDLVILTDGEDHDFDMDRIAETLNDAGVDILVIGIGDPVTGARIPVENEEGNLTYLKFKDREVFSKLEESTLKELVSKIPGSKYVGAATSAFDLGGLYIDYAFDKPVAESANGEAYVVYREAGLILIGLSLVLFLLTDGFGRKFLPVLLASIATGLADPNPGTQLEGIFAEAVRLQRGGQHTAAIETYNDLQVRFDQVDVAPEFLAAVRFNQGLSHLQLADEQGENSPEGALSSARMAQLCFLDAKRMNPSLDRAGMRLDPVGELISRYQSLVREMEKQQQAIQEEINQLVERLQQLYDDQMGLRSEVARLDPNSSQNRPNRRGNQEPQPDETMSPPTPQQISGLVNQQEKYHSEGQSIHGEMDRLNNMMTPPTPPGQPPVQGLLQDPLNLMAEAIDYQERAQSQLPEVPAWEMVRANQNLAGEKIQQILEMLANDSSQSDDSGDWEDYEDDWEMEDYEEGEEGMPSSQMMQGDLAAGSEMQPLPAPNYSAEELLMEEMGNLQFRQEQRAKAQAGKVEKDW